LTAVQESSFVIRVMRTTAKYIWSDYKINDDILKELRTEPVMEKNPKI
jgi:hypothetical protein